MWLDHVEDAPCPCYECRTHEDSKSAVQEEYPDPCECCSLIVEDMTWCEGLCSGVHDEETMVTAREKYRNSRVP